ncbi:MULTISPECIES: tRNA (adenosine(37)-N6)-threonylcarbamoyltransferase complex dimerization subunit type 1 TsaB [Coprobacillaceae]|uniref:tRNA (adenosine(37)-N6)-threonylcarbamoyltransferase complex dimerization subunit type 1 TsaB n=1 Tax=Coprobacillaceae TaxID=2810280 RepID=UPI000E55339A|nr:MULTISPECIES: tRNA (adenosine(37)-N6)-threonylcarbamoyltransferase complex dimerization subunit type 1 TsaB [Coprobacillaceae]RHM59208.1 tRNA (adenosine(37)-N6)-threonylcarbamoyltransferase complex dimerization subunit type 1 TsaB [Coprobacillus sp. AF33-1AC]RHS91530.1 tRNA (adenosine(37)-N6)-threonylcarbamoyltransferase complex dimerization subunit type 1 TsaB [Erysipelatoclostridium sp. AM42-17]
MKTIVMDTSNKYLVIALYDQGQCLDVIQEEGNRRQSEYAIVYLGKLLNRHHLKVKDFGEMIITIGPGSYTGVRVALTIAKTLATTTSIKIKTISSLKAYAGYDEVISVLDARSHKVFVGVYQNGHDLIKEKMIDIDEFDQLMQLYPNFKVVGDCDLVNQVQSEVNLAQNMYQLAKSESYVEDIDNLVPVYLKSVEAKKICK